MVDIPADAFWPLPPAIKETFRLAREVQEATYAGAPCHLTLDESDENNYRGRVERLSDNDVTYTALVPRYWTPT